MSQRNQCNQAMENHFYGSKNRERGLLKWEELYKQEDKT